MTISRYFLWIALTLLWFALLSAAQLPVRKRANTPIRAVLAVVKLLCGSLIAFCVVAIDSDFSYKFGFVLAALYAVLFGDAAGDLVLLLACAAKKIVAHAKFRKLRGLRLFGARIQRIRRVHKHRRKAVFL